MDRPTADTGGLIAQEKLAQSLLQRQQRTRILRRGETDTGTFRRTGRSWATHRLRRICYHVAGSFFALLR
jgi:hypothetical protein